MPHARWIDRIDHREELTSRRNVTQRKLSKGGGHGRLVSRGIVAHRAIEARPIVVSFLGEQVTKISPPQGSSAYVGKRRGSRRGKQRIGNLVNLIPVESIEATSSVLVTRRHSSHGNPTVFKVS